MSNNHLVTVSKEGDYISYSKTPITLAEVGQNLGLHEGENVFTHAYVMDVLRKIMGRSLTLIDASVADNRQNKAMKDVLRGIISDEMEFAAEWGFDQKVIGKMIPKDLDVAKLGSVAIEQALGVK